MFSQRDSSNPKQNFLLSKMVHFLLSVVSWIILFTNKNSLVNNLIIQPYFLLSWVSSSTIDLLFVCKGIFLEPCIIVCLYMTVSF